MNKIVLFFCFIFTIGTLCLCLNDDSYAARMGGGRSFGSQPTMRTPTTAPRPQPTTRPQTMNPTTAQPRPSSGMGAMGGLFGGLLAGTILGSLLGGSSGAAGAAHGGGIGFIDVILFGLLIWLGFKLFRKMRGQQSQQAEPQGYGTNQAYNTYDNNYNTQYQEQGGAWDRLSSQGSNISGFGQPNIPSGFDVNEFLQGAKAAYIRMQSSWDQRDLNDIALFATEAVMDVLREQMRSDPQPSRTELLNINLQLMNVKDDGMLQRAEVFFDVVMRENQYQQPEQVKEIWHFVRTLPDGTWKLDGIQQAM